METVIVGAITLLVLALASMVIILTRLIKSDKFRVKYLILKEKLYYFGILYHADIIIIVGGGLAGYLIYKLSQGN
jgi:hypothetical protein